MENATDVENATQEGKDPQQLAHEILSGILERMEIPAEIEISVVEEKVVLDVSTLR